MDLFTIEKAADWLGVHLKTTPGVIGVGVRVKAREIIVYTAGSKARKRDVPKTWWGFTVIHRHFAKGPRPLTR